MHLLRVNVARNWANTNTFYQVIYYKEKKKKKQKDILFYDKVILKSLEGLEYMQVKKNTFVSEYCLQSVFNICFLFLCVRVCMYKVIVMVQISPFQKRDINAVGCIETEGNECKEKTS